MLKIKEEELTPEVKQRLFNKEWRVSHLYKIKDKQKKLITFKPNKAQAHFNQNKHTRNIILKSRQLGMTTFEAIDTFDDVLFTKNFDALFIAHALEPAKDIFDNKISLSWDNFSLKDYYTSDKDSARKLKIGFGDNTYSSIQVDTSGRSGTYSRLHITEFAKLCKQFPDRAKEVIEGSIPAVPTNGRVDIESTADGSSGLFYDIFWDAWDRGEPKYPTQFKAHFYNWQWDEEIETTEPIEVPMEFRHYQEIHKLTDREISYYYLKYLSVGSNRATLKKEFPTTPEEAFESSGDKLFDAEILGRQEILSPIAEYNNFIIYKAYKLGHKYAMGCDVSEGIGQDSSTIALWDFTPAKPEIVAEYANNNIAPDMFAYEIKNLAERYENPLVAVERNNHGHTTISKLRDIYPERNIYKDDKGKLGWQTNLVSKPKMFYDMNTAVNEDLVNINSARIISEARRYDKEELRIAKTTDDTTQHFDLLTATVIGFQMKDHAGSIRKKIITNQSPVKRGTGIRGI
jgi:hypothetical protein